MNFSDDEIDRIIHRVRFGTPKPSTLPDANIAVGSGSPNGDDNIGDSGGSSFYSVNGEKESGRVSDRDKDRNRVGDSGGIDSRHSSTALFSPFPLRSAMKRPQV